MPGARRASRRIGTRRRPSPSTKHGGYATHECLFDLLRTDEVNMRINTACSENTVLTSDDLCAGSNHNINARLRIRIARFTDGVNPPIFQSDVCLDNSPMVDDHRIGNHGIDSDLARGLALPHPITDDLSPTKFHLITVVGSIRFDLDPKRCICESKAISGRGTIHI